MTAPECAACPLPDQVAALELVRLREGIGRLAEEFASNVDWSAGRNGYGDNDAWESAARQVRALLDDNQGDQC